MNTVQHLQYLYDLIDLNVATEKGKNAGPFSFLHEDMMIRFITSTPNKRASVEGLKTYLAKDILQINGGKDYVTYKNILENLEGTAKKKYQVQSGRLDACFDWDKNRDAIEKDAPGFWIQNDGGWKGLQQDCQIPWLLFQWLREDVEKHLLNFWRLCNVNTADQEYEKKQKEYMAALYGVALQEIFYRELLSKPLISRWKVIEEEKKQLAAISQEFGSERLIRDTMTEEEKRQFVAEKLTDASVQLSGLSTKLLEEGVYVVLDTEQNLNLAVEFQLLMLFDSLNIYGKTGQFLEKWLGDLCKGNLIGFFKDNPNRRKSYYELDAYVDKMFLQYWKNVPQEVKKDFPWALCTYFEQLDIQQHTPEKMDREQMKCAKSVIIQAWMNDCRSSREKKNHKNPTFDEG